MLVVGFEGYGGRGLNPAAEVAKALDGKNVSGRTVTGAVLPVRYAGLAAHLAGLLEEHDPRAVICLGLWPGETTIRLERVASNFNDFEIPDNDGVIEKGPVEPAGPASRMTTLPLDAIQTRLLADGIPARMSSTPGNFLCNATMYMSLGLAEKLGNIAACCFIYVPYRPAQVAELVATVKAEQALELHQRGDLASMSLETAVQAIEIAAETTLDAAG
ncbi:MAG: hypothetical protein ACR2PM_14880 [Hyphomicrobiales bacterium]